MTDQLIFQKKLDIKVQQLPQKKKDQHSINVEQEKAHLVEAYHDFKERLCFDFIVCHDVSDFNQLKEKLNMIPGNADPVSLNTMRCISAGCFFLLFPPIYWLTRTVFEVDANHFAFVLEQSEKGRVTKIYGPGFHVIGYFNEVAGCYCLQQNYPNNIIKSPIGDVMLVKVVQGTIMHFDCGGQNIILGPGIHYITEPMVFIRNISLDSFFIQIGPEKWVTVPTGYDGISINRGMVKVLEGGKQHHLSHIGDRFAKMVPKTLLTDRITTDIDFYIQKIEENQKIEYKTFGSHDGFYLRTTTSEGAFVHLDTMIFWKIIDTELAAKTAMQFIIIEDIDHHSALKQATQNISDLRANVLRICKMHLTSEMGKCSISSKTSLSDVFQKKNQFSDDVIQLNDNSNTMEQSQQQKDKKQEISFQNQLNNNYMLQQQVHSQQNFEILNYLQDQCSSLRERINEDLKNIGVQLQNICIFTVIPSKDIQVELDKQTKTKVDMNTAIIQSLANRKAALIDQESKAQQSLIQAKNQQELTKLKAFSDSQAQLTIAKNQANIVIIKAESESLAQITMANGESESIIKVAEARKKEALELQSVQIAKDLAQMRVIGEVSQKMFKGPNNNFVFGQNPGDFMFSLLNNIANKK